MKRIVIIAGIALLSAGMWVSGQTTDRPGAKKGERYEMRQGNREHMNPEKRERMNPEKRAEMMATQLQLSEAEQMKLKALFEKQEAKAAKHREEMKKQRDENRAKMEAERKANQAELIKVIGQEKFNELQAKRIAHLQRQNQELKMRKNGDRPEFRHRKMMRHRANQN